MHPSPVSRRADFMLAEGETYLNAGTFSALPKAVFDCLVDWQRSAEANPTRVAARRKREAIWQAQTAMAGYLAADPNHFVFHINVTQALNQALMGYDWPGDGELIHSNHEYPAILRCLREVSRRRGLTVRAFDLPVLPTREQDLVDAVAAALRPETRGVLLSHVSCITGTVLPLEPIARLLARHDIRLIVDGAHGPGLLPLHLDRLGDAGVDFYGGNLHKWFMGPKGTAFLYVRPALQRRLQPTIVGFGGTWADGDNLHEPMDPAAGRFVHAFGAQGLRDVSPLLALQATLDYRRRIGESVITDHIAALVARLRQRLGADLALACRSPLPPLQAGLITFLTPPSWRDPEASERLYQRFGLTVPIWCDPAVGWMMRVSPHIWNDEHDIDRLAAALADEG